MTNVTLGRWLLVALAIVGLAFAAPAVSAHGGDTTADDGPVDNATDDDWTAWMESHMGAGSVEWMESHMGAGSVEWMESHTGAPAGGTGHGMGGATDGGTYGPGNC